MNLNQQEVKPDRTFLASHVTLVKISANLSWTAMCSIMLTINAEVYSMHTCHWETGDTLLLIKLKTAQHYGSILGPSVKLVRSLSYSVLIFPF